VSTSCVAEEGQRDAAYTYVRLLADQGRVGELEALADGGDTMAAYELPKVLAEPAARARADAGDEHARRWLVRHFANGGRVDDLRAAAAAGWQDAQSSFVGQLATRGHSEELRSLAESDAPFARQVYYGWLARQDRLDVLRGHADSGDRLASWALAETLVKRGEITELYDRAATGDLAAAREMRTLMYPPDDEDRPDC
jgi:hypothetical protein